MIPRLKRQTKKRHSVVTDYVLDHYINRYGLCDLCANTGIVDTTGTTSPAGVVCGGRHYCLCPNGQHMRANAVPIGARFTPDV